MAIAIPAKALAISSLSRNLTFAGSFKTSGKNSMLNCNDSFANFSLSDVLFLFQSDSSAWEMESSAEVL